MVIVELDRHSHCIVEQMGASLRRSLLWVPIMSCIKRAVISSSSWRLGLSCPIIALPLLLLLLVVRRLLIPIQIPIIHHYHPTIMGADQDIPLPWSSSMTELVTKAQILRQSIIKASAMQESNSCTNNS